MNENDYLNNKNPTPPERKEDEERIGVVYVICAAIWFHDDKKHEHQPKNVDKGFVVAGRRHHNCYITAFILLGESIAGKMKATQGFLTSDDRFLDRKEAGKLAHETGQIKKLTNCLFSEDLY